MVKSEKYAAARVWFALACAASREHVAVADRALKRYGEHGPMISGCVREHFPGRVKDKLRLLARTVTRYSYMAWAARPSRARAATMRALSSAIARRDGHGFYGPRECW